MAKNKKDLSGFSAEELYELAKKREVEERQQQREAMKEKVADLKQKRRSLIAEHNKAIAAIDAEIAEITGKKVSAKSRSSGTSAAVISLLKSGELDTKTIREKLTAKGVAVGNLAQTMAYLKRTGKVVSTGRGRYKSA